MEYTEGKKLNDYPNSVSLKGTEIILDQMKNMICKIYIKEEFNGTGFFCKIPYNDDLLPVLMTNNHIINESILETEQKISISMNNKFKKIEIADRIKYTNKDFDITIIEIKEKDQINNFLELDDNIIEKDNLSYLKESIYLLHYSVNKNIEVSYGIIKEEENEHDFNHLCSAGINSSGGPILKLSNNKLIGIHKGGNSNKDYNLGLFLKYALNGFVENNKKLFEFNEKYGLNIKDLNITKLDLSSEHIGNEGLKLLCELELKELRELNLSNNNLSDISILEKAKFEKLEKLNLLYNIDSGCNNNTFYNVLEKVNFKELKELKINFNDKVQDMSVLEKVKFAKLECLTLYWHSNLVDNTQIKVLEKVDFKELKELDLYCPLNDISFLENVKFEKLEKLYLKFIIEDLSVFSKLNFSELKELTLKSKDYSGLENVKFEKLEKLEMWISDL